METLFQLSYTGTRFIIVVAATRWHQCLCHQSEHVASTMNGREATDTFRLMLSGLVEKIGFEPTTFCLPDRRSARLSYIPMWERGLDSNQCRRHYPALGAACRGSSS